MKTWQRVALGVAIAAMVVAANVAILKQPYHTYRIPTGGMSPTLPVGSHVIARMTRDVHVGDIIVFRYPLSPKVLYVQRIVAEPGAVVEIIDKRLFVNGKERIEPYAVHEDDEVYPNRRDLPEPYRSRDQFGPFRVPAASFFTMGDNRDRSSDSRYWGALPQENVVGRIVGIYSLKGFRRVH